MKNKIPFALNVFNLIMLMCIWKIVLWDLIPRTNTTKEKVIVLLGLAIITAPMMLHSWSNALKTRIQHHLGRMLHYKGGNVEQFNAHKNDLEPLIWWRKVTTILAVVVILSMIIYRYL